VIVRSSDPVTLVGGAGASPAEVAESLRLAPRLVAADGGADAALAAGAMPEAVIGDLDSLSDAARRAIPAGRVHALPEQETTDFDKCLRLIEAPWILGLGFLGGRLDHALAALSGLMRARERPCLLVGHEDVALHCPPSLALSLPAGSRVSLYPLAPVRVSATGLAWPLDALDLVPGGRLGTSNTASGGTVTITPAGPGLLVILPRAARDAALSALRPPD